MIKGLMLKMKLQYFGHLMRGADSLEKALVLGTVEGRRRRGDRGWDDWMASSTRWTWVWVDSGDGQGGLACCGSWGHKESDTTERLNWTEPTQPLSSPSPPAFNLSLHQGLFKWVSTSHQVVKVLEFQHQDWFPLGWTNWISFQSKGLSRVFSNNTVQKHQFFSPQLSL